MTCETKSVLSTQCGTDLLCLCACTHDQIPMARTVSQHQHKTSTLFSPFPAVLVTFVAVVTQIVAACMGACMGASKVMTDD